MKQLRQPWVEVVALILVVLLTIGVMLHAAYAHEAPSGMPYSGWCCNENDCAPINYEDVTEHPDGSVTFRHCRFRESDAEFWKMEGDGYLKNSTDGQWHACILPDSKQGVYFEGGPYQNNGQCRCLYRPLRGF